MTKKFDLVVIGTGTAAAAAAHPCRSAGWKVAVIDSRPFGGTCSQRGCDPKKVLVGASELLDFERRMTEGGTVTGSLKIDWPELMRFKRTFTEPVAQNMESWYKGAGIDAFHGTARFVGESAVEVGGETLEGRFVLIASGARPATLNLPGEELVITSDDFLNLHELPGRIVFIGGGYISFEFAHIAARAGAKVTVLHRSARPLKGFDPDLVQSLVEATRGIGIDLRLKTQIESIEDSNGLLVNTTSGPIEADLVVHGAGRVPNIDALDLESAGVEYARGGIAINEYLQSTTNPAVYAAGDSAASGGPPLTPIAGIEGRAAASNMLGGNTLTPDYTGVPTVVFTSPTMASVGLSEEAAREQGLDFKTNLDADTSSWFTSRRIGEKHSGFKVLVEKGTGRILGAHLLGPHSEEIINIFALAIRVGIDAPTLQSMPYAYPTSCSDIYYMAR